MKLKLLLVAAVLSLGGLALALPGGVRFVPTWDNVEFKRLVEFEQTVTIQDSPYGNSLDVNGPVVFDGGVFFVQEVTIDAGLIVKSISVGVGGAAISKSVTGTLVWDFRELKGVGATISEANCSTSPSVTVTGAALGDVCLTNPAVPPASWDGTIQAHPVGANAVQLVACASSMVDGGSFNPPDSGYTVRCF